MVVISREYHFCTDKAVQISPVEDFDKGIRPEFPRKKQNCPIKQDIISSLCLALLGPNFLEISILLYVLCTHKGKNVF